jgi:YfiH family protein
MSEIVWGISQKKDGSMKYVGRESASIINRENFFNSKGVDPKKVVIAGLIHGKEIKIVREEDRGKFIPDVDGLVTDTRDVYLSATAADCLPIYYIDRKQNVIGLAHAGWRGTAKNIAAAMVEVMVRDFKCDPRDIEVIIGPYIKACHFEVEKIIDEFLPFPSSIHRENDKLTIDLGQINKEQLMAVGIAEDRIVISDECTYCLSEKYYSYRRDKPSEIEAVVAYIGIKP